MVTVKYHKKTRPFYTGGKVITEVTQNESLKKVWTGKWIYKNKDKQTFLTPRQEFRILRITGADEVVGIDDQLYYKTFFTAGTEAVDNQPLFMTKGKTKKLKLKN